MSKPCEIVLPDTVSSAGKDISKNISKTEQTADEISRKSSAEPPVPDERIISNDSEIFDKPVPEEAENDSEALSKVKIVSVSENEIIDDSYTLEDDTSTFKDIAPSAEKSKNAKIIVLDAGHGGHDTGAIGQREWSMIS